MTSGDPQPKAVEGDARRLEHRRVVHSASESVDRLTMPHLYAAGVATGCGEEEDRDVNR